MKWTIKPPSVDGLRRSLRRVRGIAGYVLLAFLLFIAFVWISLPTRAIAWRISHEAKSRGYIIDVEDVSLSPFGDVSLLNVTWTYAPSRSGQIPRNFFVEEVEVDVSLFRLLFGTLHVDVEAKVDEGTLTAMYERDDEESAIKIDIEELPLYDVPKLQQSVNAPVRGLFGLHVDLTMEGDKFAKALGTIDISCARCRIGDGETLVFIPGVKKGIMAKGITLPEIDFGSLKGRLNVENGQALTEGIETSSDDLKFKLLGSMNLSDPFSRSEFEFDLKVLLTEELQSQSEPLRLMVQTRSKNTFLDAPEEDWMGFKLRGTVSKPEFMGIKSKSRAERIRERKEKSRAKARKKAAAGSKKKAKKPAKKPARKPEPKPEPKPDPREEEAEATARNTEEPAAPTAVLDSTQIDTATPEPSDKEAEEERSDEGEGEEGEGEGGGSAEAGAETSGGGETTGGGEGEGGDTGAGSTGSTGEDAPT